MIVAEIGSDMSRFPTANHLAAWAGLAPGNNESAGKRRYGKTRQGNRLLKTGLVQVSHAVAHMKNNYLSAQYHRLAARRGKKKAVIAVAHSVLIIAYYMLKRREPYQDLGSNCFDELKPEVTVKRLTKRLERLGFQVAIQPLPLKVQARAHNIFKSEAVTIQVGIAEPSISGIIALQY